MTFDPETKELSNYLYDLAHENDIPGGHQLEDSDSEKLRKCAERLDAQTVVINGQAKELEQLKARIRSCYTMTEAEKIAVVRLAQELAVATGIDPLESSPADVVAAVQSLIGEHAKENKALKERLDAQTVTISGMQARIKALDCWRIRKVSDRRIIVTHANGSGVAVERDDERDSIAANILFMLADDLIGSQFELNAQNSESVG